MDLVFNLYLNMNNFNINYKLLNKALSIISLLIIFTPLIIVIIPLTLNFEQSSSTSKTTTTISTISQTKNNFEISDRKSDPIQTNILNKQGKLLPECDERITDEYQEFNLENDVNCNESV
jgi:hypothetical protein